MVSWLGSQELVVAVSLSLGILRYTWKESLSHLPST